MRQDLYPTLDYADFPSIVIPLESPAGLVAHAHPQHQLTWAPDGVLTMVVEECRWVVQRARALWIPGGTPHSVVPTASCEMLSLYFETGDCPLDWRVPTVVDASGLIGPLLTYRGAGKNRVTSRKGDSGPVIR
ncbi:AraC family ligand binding domain-containing protein [Nocardia sp. NBC_01327]|uniref:AraC family ligand binding domain-containing protein n=1 Tax=Nocardia sp. NBC_01327 TaxID=2903593 RepID=UPI002E141E4D|nr:hypothetical protein OG326_42880 [Nocardia sp. NBC_01327]